MHIGILDKCPTAPRMAWSGFKAQKAHRISSGPSLDLSEFFKRSSLATPGLAMCSSKRFKIITRLFWLNLWLLKCTQLGRLARAAELREDVSQPSAASLHTSLLPFPLRRSLGLVRQVQYKANCSPGFQQLPHSSLGAVGEGKGLCFALPWGDRALEMQRSRDRDKGRHLGGAQSVLSCSEVIQRCKIRRFIWRSDVYLKQYFSIWKTAIKKCLVCSNVNVLNIHVWPLMTCGLSPTAGETKFFWGEGSCFYESFLLIDFIFIIIFK